jgi:CO dehydrogenase/acetyl-CoA synthase alpha subunit
MLLAEKLSGTSADRDAAQKEYADLETSGEVCIECAKCEEKCPYGLPIIERIRSVHETLG